ncbi:MAG: hypothetical protein ACLP6G_15220 [Terriglobales bacterium]
MALVMLAAPVQGPAWAQLSAAPAETQLARNFTTPLETSSPALLAQPSTTASARLLPCNQMTTGPRNLPDAPSAYLPLSRHCKFELVLRQSYSPYTFASAAYNATWAQVWGQWPQYGGGMQGWGKRLGSTLADAESRRFIQTFVLATVLHEDPRYFPSGKRGLVSRGWYATTRVLVTRDDYGRNVLNRSELMGASLVSSLQDAYYPRPDRTFGATMNRLVGTLSGDATTNLLHEFTPDLKRLFHKHCPQGIQRLEARMPIPENMKP